MSARALQRVVVRMLYDPAFADGVYADPAAALAGEPLTAAERAWLVAADRRRWAADPLRRYRGLQGLLEEFPASGALVVRHNGGVPALDAFFSSPAFHRCVMDRGSLAGAFGAWMARFGGEVAAVARLEAAVAHVRRAPPRTPPDAADCWATAPWIDVFRAPAETPALHQHLAARLAAHPEGPVAAVVDGSVKLADRPALGAETEGFIAERTPEGAVTVGEAPTPLVTLLERLRAPAPTARVQEWLRALGADPGEEAELLAAFVADALLVPGKNIALAPHTASP